MILGSHGINLSDVIKVIQQRKFDYLKKASIDAGGNTSDEAVGQD